MHLALQRKKKLCDEVSPLVMKLWKSFIVTDYLTGQKKKGIGFAHVGVLSACFHDIVPNTNCEQIFFFTTIHLYTSFWCPEHDIPLKKKFPLH